MTLTVWCNRRFRAEADRLLRQGLQAHRLVMPLDLAETDVAAAGQGEGLDTADIAFGQPPAEACAVSARLRWIQTSSAGYARYDQAGIREALQARGVILTTASPVFADPCAQHALAMILGLARQLPASHRDQLADHSWNYEERRYQSDLLTGQTVLLLGFGAIARRLVELLVPFRCRVFALRRQTRSVPGVRIVTEQDLTAVLPVADHVVNLLPDNEHTRGWMNARRFGCLRPGARFYNLGRGSTVDQKALWQALERGRLDAAYLDVTDPEPLPPSHPLWTARGCFITPHTAGGWRDQDETVVGHFLSNLQAFTSGEPLAGRVV